MLLIPLPKQCNPLSAILALDFIFNTLLYFSFYLCLCLPHRSGPQLKGTGGTFQVPDSVQSACKDEENLIEVLLIDMEPNRHRIHGLKAQICKCFSLWNFLQFIVNYGIKFNAVKLAPRPTVSIEKFGWKENFNHNTNLKCWNPILLSFHVTFR